jgi:glycosyltransferase involved in cell wall biosynthesis
MKILILTPFLPTPPRFGAERRVDGLAQELARRHEVWLFWFNFDDGQAADSLARTREYCARVVTSEVRRGTDAVPKRLLQLGSMFSARSFEFLRAKQRRDCQRALDELLTEQEFDVVQVESAHLAAFDLTRGNVRSRIVVLDEHNIEYDVAKRAARAPGSVGRTLYNALNWRKLAREERAAWRRFDGVALTSRRDEQLLLRHVPSARTAVVPNGVDLEAFAPSKIAPEPGRLLFFGALNYFPNQDGLMHFIDDIWPIVRRRDAHARLMVVGPGVPEALLSRPRNGVEVVGLVSDIGAHIERASAVIVPLRVGGGTRLKILEALAKGKAVISTSAGAEGLALVDEQHLLIADEPETFARQVARILADPALASRLGSEGRKLVSDQYAWPSIVAGLETFYARLFRARGLERPGHR